MLNRVPDMREMIEITQRTRMTYSFLVFSGALPMHTAACPPLEAPPQPPARHLPPPPVCHPPLAAAARPPPTSHLSMTGFSPDGCRGSRPSRAGVYTTDDTEEKTHDQCAAVAKLLSVRSVAMGTVVAAADHPNGEFVMLYQGKLRRTRLDTGETSADGANEQTLSPGGYAGGVAMLRGDGTRENIVTDSACLLLVAGVDEFFSLLELLPPLSSQLMLRAFGRRAPLSALLAWPKSFAAFQQHQASEHAAESSEFWAESETFIAEASRQPEPAPPAAAAALRETAQRLVSTYVADGSEQQLNLPSNVQKELMAAVEAAAAAAAPPRATLFDAARHEMYDLMTRDTLPRFVQAAAFEALLTELAEPASVSDCEPPLSLAAAREAYTAKVGGVSNAGASERTGSTEYKTNYDGSSGV